MHSCMCCCRQITEQTQSISPHLCNKCYQKLRELGMPPTDTPICIYCGMIWSGYRDTCPRCGEKVKNEDP